MAVQKVVAALHQVAWARALLLWVQLRVACERNQPWQSHRVGDHEKTGAAQYYTGTDTVRGGKIVAADVTRTG